MKINLYALLGLSLYVNHMYPIDHKITQIIYVEKENTHDKKSNGLYCVTENHELYFLKEDQIKTDAPTTVDKSTKCTLYEQSTKDYLYRPIVEDRVMLIGQPMYIDKTWTMPAIIGKKGLLGKLFRPEICLIVYTPLNKNDISNKPEPLLKQPSPTEPLEMTDLTPESKNKPYFVIQRLTEGHRTKVTKIGFFKNLDQLLLVSGSEWPTVKSYDINLMEQIHYNDNRYLIDIISNNHLITTEVEKPWLARNTFTFKSIHTRKTDDNKALPTLIEQKNLPYLPTIFFDPTENYENEFITQTFTNYLQASQNEKDWTHSTCFISSDYAIIFFPHLKKYNIYIKDNNKDEINFTKINEKIIDGKNNILITACAFDFANKELFYSTYDKKGRKADIKKFK